MTSYGAAHGVGPDDLLAVLQNPKRRKILVALSIAQMSVTELMNLVQYHKSDVSQQLRKMLNCGLVQYRTVKKEHQYSLTNHVRIVRSGALIHIDVDDSKGHHVRMEDELTTLTTTRFDEFEKKLKSRHVVEIEVKKGIGTRAKQSRPLHR